MPHPPPPETPHHRSRRARTGNELLRGFAELRSGAPQLRLPLYVAHGTDDRCTNAAASRALVAAASSPDKVFVDVEGGYHELLMGPERDACVARMVDWMVVRAGAAAGAAAGAPGAPSGGGAATAAAPRL